MGFTIFISKNHCIILPYNEYINIDLPIHLYLHSFLFIIHFHEFSWHFYKGKSKSSH